LLNTLSAVDVLHDSVLHKSTTDINTDDDDDAEIGRLRLREFRRRASVRTRKGVFAQ